jgi:hypothetical protein
LRKQNRGISTGRNGGDQTNGLAEQRPDKGNGDGPDVNS